MVEQVFKGGAKEVNDKNVMKTFLTEIIDVWYTSCKLSVYAALRIGNRTDGIRRGSCRSDTHLVVVGHRFSLVPAVQSALVETFQLRETGEPYKLYSHLLVVEQICPFEYHTKRTLADFLSNPIVNADDIRRRRRHDKSRRTVRRSLIGWGNWKGGGREVAIPCELVFRIRGRVAATEATRLIDALVLTCR